MFELTLLNGKKIVVNLEMIKLIQEVPDTLITLISGDKFMVKETSLLIMKVYAQYRNWLHNHQVDNMLPELSYLTTAPEDRLFFKMKDDSKQTAQQESRE